jgi:SpoVK/Ycf46/Vps4 family AAA+-type ATPase
LEGIDDAVRSRITHRLSSKARLVRATEGMAELVVSDEVALLLRILVANYRHRRRVLDDWGFGARFGKGLGLSALFSGPPGTGKTMAAAAVARELGVPLYQIELSQIVSKWVGETEKAIDEVFAEAEAASAALLFDEADSLFARRTEVSSANDRYANLEVNHLLQKVENFSGVVLLTTNNPSVVDTAFLRRFSYHVAFVLPSPDERATLWKSLIPAAAPIASPIRYDQLGRDFELSGGHIKNAVIRAAWFAAELDRPISETLLRLTAHLEVKQLGGVVRDVDVGRALEELLRR